MSEYAIQVENLSKRYRIGTREKQHDTLMSVALTWLKSPVNNFRQLRRLSSFNSKDEADVLWALKDVSFNVKQGEAVGIIGRNGAGKSTLLKILSRITAPTTGRVLLNGRVASLLEVGTGFHPELSGRENLYLNGTILGMTKMEVDQRFDEIVDFSGVEKFIDTPVKWYSSGMRVRLAFSVAAYLNPEILLIDEVLAVGDIAFQQKCLNKMQEIAGEGHTVLFVSHNMATIQSLCKKGVLLQAGMVECLSDIETCIHYYVSNLNAPPHSNHGKVAFSNLHVVKNGSGSSGDSFSVNCRLHINTSIPEGFRLFCIIQGSNGEVMVHARTDTQELPFLNKLEVHDVSVLFPPLWFRSGSYTIHFKLMINDSQIRYVSEHILLSVSEDVAVEMLLGFLTPEVHWEIKHLQEISL